MSLKAKGKRGGIEKYGLMRTKRCLSQSALLEKGKREKSQGKTLDWTAIGKVVL